jgi:hypothetical protein
MSRDVEHPALSTPVLTSPPSSPRPSRIGVDLTTVAALDAIFIVWIL